MQHFLYSVSQVWNEWEVRGLILFSLFLQIILVIFGSLRKYVARSWIQFAVWSAYLMADWVATFALGVLARNIRSEDCKENISSKSVIAFQALWAPFLLLHLGGPDTITAFSIEDNDLWLRHFIGLFAQLGVALYVFFKSLSRNTLTFFAIPVFITAVIKYGERTWVLRSSSTKQFRDSLLSDPNPGPDYAKYVEAFESTIVEPDLHDEAMVVPQEEIDPDQVDDIYLANYLFKRFKYLFADLILGYRERTDCYKIIHKKSAEDAFNLIATELGFLYDVLYTKATIAYSITGIVLRFISLFSSIAVLVAFYVKIDRHAYPPTDIKITQTLLIVALFFDICGFILLIFSDRVNLSLTKRKTSLANIIRCVISPFLSLPCNSKRWSGVMAQYNLVSYCLKPEKCVTVEKLLGIHETLEKLRYRTWKEVDNKLQNLIHKQLWEKVDKFEDGAFDITLCKQLMAHRGDYVLEKWKCLDEFKWCTIDVEFDHSLLLWHIATDLCIHDDLNNGEGASQISKRLSDYMLYLLVVCPSMLPKGIGEIRYRDTCAEAKRFFKQRRILISNKIDKACDELLKVNTNASLEKIKGDRSQSVLFYGCKLAKQLKALDQKAGWENKNKWEMISEVWVEMLVYAASRCEWKEHGQQLRKGGELLTHVCLLMAHLGFSEQYQIQKDYIFRSQPSRLEKLFRDGCFFCLLRGTNLCIHHCIVRCDHC